MTRPLVVYTFWLVVALVIDGVLATGFNVTTDVVLMLRRVRRLSC